MSASRCIRLTLDSRICYGGHLPRRDCAWSSGERRRSPCCREESNREASRSFLRQRGWVRREWREDIPAEQVRTSRMADAGVIDQEHNLAMSLVAWLGLRRTRIRWSIMHARRRSGTCIRTMKIYRWNSLRRDYAISSRAIRSTEVCMAFKICSSCSCVIIEACDHSAYRCCTQATTCTIISNYTILTHRATTRGGRRRASARTTARHRAS